MGGSSSTMAIRRFMALKATGCGRAVKVRRAATMRHNSSPPRHHRARGAPFAHGEILPSVMQHGSSAMRSEIQAPGGNASLWHDLANCLARAALLALGIVWSPADAAQVERAGTLWLKSAP